MNRLTRDAFVERTHDLMLRQGTPDVSLSSVLTACGANKGSLYHFFPEGKSELLVAAMERQAECALASNRRCLSEAKSTSDAAFRLLRSLAGMIESENCPEFLPFSAAGAICDESSESCREVCAATLESLEKLYVDSLRGEGASKRVAKSVASMIISTVEGALLQSRTLRTSAPLFAAATHLRDLIELKVAG
ncbi:MAG: TetR/AcrR family transcriptional regulator [Planctomycetota bacterium]